MTLNQHLDYDALNALRDVMDDNFDFLIETFITDSTERLHQLQELVNVAVRNNDAIRRASHSFKGSCSNIGAFHLARLCAGVEMKILQSKFEGLPEDVKIIQQEFALVKKLLAEYMSA